MSQAVVQELENLGLLQSQAVIQWRAGEGEHYPFEGTLETVVFRDLVERGLELPVSEFFYALLQFWGIQLHHLTPQSVGVYRQACSGIPLAVRFVGRDLSDSGQRDYL